MPRFRGHNQYAVYTPEEQLALSAAITQHLPCRIQACNCPRIEHRNQLCNCYQQKGEECCSCSLVELYHDERFLAYALAWRRNPRWHASDRSEDAKPAGEWWPVPIEVKVGSPRRPGWTAFAWRSDLTVGAAAEQVRASFGYALSAPGLAKGDDILDPTKTLYAAGVRDGDRLDFVDVGGNV